MGKTPDLDPKPKHHAHGQWTVYELDISCALCIVHWQRLQKCSQNLLTVYGNCYMQYVHVKMVMIMSMNQPRPLYKKTM